MQHIHDARLATAVRRVLAIGGFALLATGGQAVAKEPGTATRLQADETQQLFPVAVYDRETLERSGHVMLADFLRGTVFNSAGSFRPQSGSSAQSFAGYSTWGLGSSRNLILIDGRRTSVAPNVGSAQDLNAIPMAMVERIEILPQAAAAVHGTDAMSGVINIITRSDFDGAEVMIGASDPTREGGDTTEFSALMGISGDRGNIMLGVSRSDREIIFARDRAWSEDGYSNYSNNFVNPSFSYYSNPTHGTAVPAGGCSGGAFTDLGTAGPGRFCYYEYTQYAADDAAHGNESLFVRGDYAISADWRYFFDTRVSRVESFGRYAPAPSLPWPGGLPVLAVGSPNHPATSPANGGLNPLWADYQDVAAQELFLAHRFAATGPRDTFTDMNDYVLDMGVETSLFGVDWTAGVRSSESKYFEIGSDYIVARIAQQFIDSGSYNIYDPLGVDEGVANSIAATTNREAMFYEKSVYLDGFMEWLALPGGDATLAFGGEYREVDFADNYDSLSEGGQIVGSAGNSAGGGRNVKSFFGEAMLPVLDDLDLNVAFRYDDYSDAGDSLGARVAASYVLLDSLSVRGSFSQAGHAPTLDTITQSPAFSSVSVVIPWIGIGPPPANPVVVDSYSISNPDLESEESDILSMGVVFEPFSWLSGSLDYVSTEIDGRITAISAQQIVNCLAGTSTRCPDDISFLDASGPQPQPQNGIGAAYADNGNPFSILFIQTGFVNTGSLEMEGLDLRLDARFDLGPGVIRHELMLSQVLSYTVDGGADLAGSYGLPERRINLRNTYDFASFSASWNLNYIGPQDETSFGGRAGVDSWLTHDIQVAYALPWDGRVALGVINMTDEDPPLDAGEGRGYNFSLFNGYGRLPYLRYTQSF